MKRRTTIIKRLRERIEQGLYDADLYRKTGDVAGEAYRRGQVAAYGLALQDLVVPGDDNWMFGERASLAQANHITALRNREKANV